MRDYKVGDIIHFSKFRWDDGARSPNLAADEPLWGRVVSHEHFQVLCGLSSEELENEESVSFYSPCDKWRVVPEDEVPDEVWAAIARKALTE